MAPTPKPKGLIDDLLTDAFATEDREPHLSLFGHYTSVVSGHGDSSCTITLPFMPGWMVHPYGYVPGSWKLWRKTPEL